MRALLQRGSSARVTVAGRLTGEIGPGLLILICAMRGDTEAEADQLAAKIIKLRIFRDADDKMNLSLRETGRAALIVSQFTLAADTSRGNRRRCLKVHFKSQMKAVIKSLKIRVVIQCSKPLLVT